ncbi:MAG: hypothetical protein JO204_17945 [Alphaproteobacteria bacterium]|nr:hypothetical protein [Alphaproteobacteria bacterium]
MSFAVWVMLALLLVTAARAQAPDPFESAPGPAVIAPKPAPRPRPVRRAEPQREPADVAPSRAPAPVQGTLDCVQSELAKDGSNYVCSLANPQPRAAPSAGPFDGTYTGRVTAGYSAIGGKHNRGMNCTMGQAVQMKITGGAVAIQQARPDGELAQYSGSVDATGVVTAASAVAFDGWAHRVSGSINQGRFAGVIRRRECEFNVELSKG